MDRDGEIARILAEAYPSVDSADPVSYVSELGDSVQALVYARLFWPKLVEFEGAVFIALWGDDESYISERLRTPAPDPSWGPLSWESVVDSFNKFEVAHIFRQYRGPAEVSDQANYELGQVLVQTWSARLAGAYPERKFTVRFSAADEVMDSRIEVRQAHPQLNPPAGWSDRHRAILSELTEFQENATSSLRRAQLPSFPSEMGVL
jgi:hypothetical protein